MARDTKSYRPEQGANTGTTFRLFTVTLSSTFRKLSALLQAAGKVLPKGLILSVSFETLTGSYEYRDSIFQVAKAPGVMSITTINALDVLDSLEIRAPSGTPTLLVELVIQED